ncbi:MAG TPA: fused MFS/spermidine synthase [Terracidiphilus sp.]|jgi:SAM-dependent methyltransferase|nr:fused MFS/spermidine synthase [Terracidiphilus sp.]
MSHLRFLFAAAVFLAAFLLFMVEPIAARQLLPVLGGSASVWITCLVFFQTALLVGYLYAHWLAKRPHGLIHLLLLVLALASSIMWAQRPLAAAAGDRHPIATVFGALSFSIGLPFLVLAATSPLMQAWWARLLGGNIPYRLYALSNLASLLALALYPSLIEPSMTLRAQRLTWCCGFAAFALIAAWLARTTRGQAASAPAGLQQDDAEPASLRDKLLWVLLPMGAAMQLCAITAYLTANVAAIPLLWILPLGVYLLTIIFAFQFRASLPWGIIARFMVVMLGALAWSLSKTSVSWPLWLSLLFFLLELFFACFFCHSAAYALRPKHASEATLFYLLFAAGGALGSFLIGIASPLAFNLNLDLPIAFLVTALLALAVNWQSNWSQRMLWIVASAAMVVLVFMVRRAYLDSTVLTVRNFYASLRVRQDHSYPGTTVRTLLNGSIQHGTQIFGSDELRHTPTTYYATDSGVGYALRFCCLLPDGSVRPRNIGAIGLGAGTIAAYGQPGDHIRFYEINPAVEPIARNVFTYIRESGAQIDVVPGDARNSLAHEPPQKFDVLVVDAFTGDAIPLHLLTTEAIALYRRHLAPGGILAFHISNQHVNLGPPIARLAASAGMQVRLFSTVVDPNNPSSDQPGEFSATWVLVTDNTAFLAQPEVAVWAQPMTVKPGMRVWTDDYSALLPVLRW